MGLFLVKRTLQILTNMAIRYEHCIFPRPETERKTCPDAGGVLWYV